jgi:Protein of unknown function (DUF4058)
MPVHDWTKVDAGIFHDFHTAWIIEIRNALNNGVLPEGYYALAEQHAGRFIPDVLALHVSPVAHDPPSTPYHGGLALADAPPRVRRKLTVAPSPRFLRRTLAIRHVSGHRLVALIEVVSPANKDRRDHVVEFATKVVSALRADIHVLLIDLFSFDSHDEHGMQGAILELLDDAGQSQGPPADEPLTLVSYVAGPQVEAYVEPLAVGQNLPEMPLFLQADRYINIPLGPTYQAAFHGAPLYWREILERA